MDTVFDRVGSLDCLIISYTLHDQWLWKHLSVNGLCHPKYDVCKAVTVEFATFYVGQFC